MEKKYGKEETTPLDKAAASLKVSEAGESSSETVPETAIEARSLTAVPAPAALTPKVNWGVKFSARSSEDALRQILNLKPDKPSPTQLGEGSYAKVYKWLDEHGTPFAVKFINYERSPEYYQGHKGEIIALCTSPHKHIVRSYAMLMKDDDTEDQYCLIQKPGQIPTGNFFICAQITEFIDGGDLFSTVAGESAQGIFAHPSAKRPELALLVGRQLVDALIHLQDQGIMHRDIKPENILLSPRKDHIWLCDFGFARYVEPERPSSPCGTPLYTSPEANAAIKRGKPQEYDVQSDVWALGIVLQSICCVSVYGEEDPKEFPSKQEHRFQEYTNQSWFSKLDQLNRKKLLEQQF
ncbi:MAG: protein kinase, partial [Cytophagales bacterium]|nr:protein kinase [Cytophagales bacterium]